MEQMSKSFAKLLEELNDRLSSRFSERPKKSARTKQVVQQGPLTLIISPEKDAEATKAAKVIPLKRERR
jgi:hypothetical protein